MPHLFKGPISGTLGSVSFACGRKESERKFFLDGLVRLMHSKQSDISQLSVEKVVIRNDREEQLLFLREVGGSAVFPIAVGLYEAAAVKAALETAVSPRPLTHELIYDIVKALGGKILYAIVDNLLDGVFYAKLVLLNRDGEEVEVDCRPSDAVCIAHDAGAPLYATRALLEAVSTAGDRGGG